VRGKFLILLLLLNLILSGLDNHTEYMHGLCMATKTISIELDAYEKLSRAKTGPRDSFSKVIRRTHFEVPTPTGSELLEHLDKLFAHLPDDGISLEDALAALPEDPPVATSPWDEVEQETGRTR